VSSISLHQGCNKNGANQPKKKGRKKKAKPDVHFFVHQLWVRIISEQLCVGLLKLGDVEETGGGRLVQHLFLLLFFALFFPRFCLCSERTNMEDVIQAKSQDAWFLSLAKFNQDNAGVFLFLCRFLFSHFFFFFFFWLEEIILCSTLCKHSYHYIRRQIRCRCEKELCEALVVET
jgi:hypothetical protein